MGCSNIRCNHYGKDHYGVGQSPEHPDDITGVVGFWLVVFGIFFVVLLIAAIAGVK